MGVNVCECVLGRVPGRACVFVFCWGEGGESGGRGQRKEERARPRPASNIIPAFLSTPLSPLATPAPSATTHTATTHTHTPAPCPPPPSACPPPPASPRSGGVGEPASPRSPPRPAPARTWRPTCVPGGEISWRCVPFFWFWGGGGVEGADHRAMRGGRVQRTRLSHGRRDGGGGGGGRAQWPRKKKKKRQRQGRGHVGPGAGAGRPSGRPPVPGRCCWTSTMSNRGVGGPGEAACRPAGGGSFFHPHPTHRPQELKKRAAH